MGGGGANLARNKGLQGFTPEEQTQPVLDYCPVRSTDPDCSLSVLCTRAKTAVPIAMCFTRFAFTLAEVLITLAIIGVVAAMTMPTLIADYRKQALKTQWKKMYSAYAQNLEQTTMIDFDGSAGCYYTDTGSTRNDCHDFFEQFAKNMNVIKTCNGNALADGCIPKYPLPATWSGCPGFTQSVVDNTDPAFVLNDGSIFIAFTGGGNEIYPILMYDVNGMKGPNKPGHDLFATEIRRQANSGGYYLSNNIDACLIIPADAPFRKMRDLTE